MTNHCAECGDGKSRNLTGLCKACRWVRWQAHNERFKNHCPFCGEKKPHHMASCAHLNPDDCS